MLYFTFSSSRGAWHAFITNLYYFEEKMPKLKTNSSAKKRFKVTSSGKVMASQANKQHNMRKRSNRQIRDQRGTDALPDVEAKRVKQFMPYA